MHNPMPIRGSREERVVQVDDLELRDDGDKAPVITGHPLVYNRWSEDLGGFKERILPGAATKTIGEADIRALFNHDPNCVIGRTKAGTLSLTDEPRGIAMEATPPATGWAADLMVSMKRKDIDQMSFSFRAIRDEFREPKKDGHLWERDLIELAIQDVSVVTFPAYVQTDAQVRTLLGGAGLDFDALAAFLTRAQRGITPTSSDLDLVEGSVAALRSYIPPAPDPALEPDTTQASPDAGRSVAHLRALLAMEAASVLPAVG